MAFNRLCEKRERERERKREGRYNGGSDIPGRFKRARVEAMAYGVLQLPARWRLKNVCTYFCSVVRMGSESVEW